MIFIVVKTDNTKKVLMEAVRERVVRNVLKLRSAGTSARKEKYRDRTCLLLQFKPTNAYSLIRFTMML
jgi:hypothetical protein